MRDMERWKLLHSEDGAVSVEFVIILPVLIAILAITVSASLHFSMASDVQQLAHELVRGAIAYAPDPGWCNQLKIDTLDPLVSNLPMLTKSRIVGINCDLQSQNNIALINVIYDVSRTPGSVLGRLVGLDLATLSRSSFVQL